MTSPSRAADQDRFTADTERFRRELLAHCYRMLGAGPHPHAMVEETKNRGGRGDTRGERGAGS